MQLTPYIMFNGNCEEALSFYEKALGGTIKDLMRFGGSPMENSGEENKDKVLHSLFMVDGNMIFMASDTGGNNSNANQAGMVHLSMNFSDEGKMTNVFNALSQGGTVTMQLQDTFWGARFGMLTDRFGVNWMFNQDKQQA